MKNKNLAQICAYDDPAADFIPRDERGVKAITDSCSVHDFLGRGRAPKGQVSPSLYKLACHLFSMSRAQRRSEIGRLTDSQRRQLLDIRLRIADSAVDYPPNIAWAIEDIMSGGQDGYSEFYKGTKDGGDPRTLYPEVWEWIEAVNIHGLKSLEAKKAAAKLGNYTVLGRVHDDDALDAYLSRGKEQNRALNNAVEASAAEAATLSDEAQKQLDETRNALEQEAQTFVASLVDTVSQIIPTIAFDQATEHAAEEAAEIVEEADEAVDDKSKDVEDENAREAELSDRFGLEYREDERMGDSVIVSVHKDGNVAVDTPNALIKTDGDEVRTTIFGFSDVDVDVVTPTPLVIPEKDADVPGKDETPEGDEMITVEESEKIVEDTDANEDEDYTEDITEDVLDSLCTRLSPDSRAVLDAIGEDDAAEEDAVEAFRTWLSETWDALRDGSGKAADALRTLSDGLRAPLKQLGVEPSVEGSTLSVGGEALVEVSDTALKVGSMSYEFDLNNRLTRTLLRNAGDEFAIVLKGVAKTQPNRVSDAEDDDLLSEKAKEEVLARVNEAVKKRLEEKGIEISDALPDDTAGAFEQLIAKGWGPQLINVINGYFARDFRRYGDIQRDLAGRYGRDIEYIADIDSLDEGKQAEALRYLASKILTEDDRMAILGEMFDEASAPEAVTDGVMDTLKTGLNIAKKGINKGKLKVGDIIQAGEALVTVVKKKATTFIGKLSNGRFKEFKYPKKMIEIPKDAIDPRDYPNGAPSYMVSDAVKDDAADFVAVIDRLYGKEEAAQREAVDDILQAVGEDERKEFEENYRKHFDAEIAEAKAGDVIAEYAAWAEPEMLGNLSAFFESLHKDTIKDAANEEPDDAWKALDAKKPLEQLGLVFDTFSAEELETYLPDAAKRLGFNSVLDLLRAISDEEDVALRVVSDFKENAPQGNYEAVETKVKEALGDAMDPNEDGDNRITINWSKEKIDEYIAKMRKKEAKEPVDDASGEELDKGSATEDCASTEALPAVSGDVHEGAPNNYDMSHTQATYSAVRNTRAALENILAAVTQALALTEPLTVEQYQQGGLEQKIMGAVSDSTFRMNELDLFCPTLYKRKFTDSAWVADNIEDIEGTFGVTIPEQFKGMSALLSTKPISDSSAAAYGGQMRLTFPYDATHTLHVVPFRED